MLYLLIGHWSLKSRPGARPIRPSSSRLADVGFVLGVVGLAVGVGSTGYAAVCSACGRSRRSTMPIRLCRPESGAAQHLPRPHHRRVLGKVGPGALPGLVARRDGGPTPASALIHAATMVAAGTVVLAGLYRPSPRPRSPAGCSASRPRYYGACGPAFIHGAESDLKRLLAWSTVSQVAIMLSALAAAPVILEQQPGEFCCRRPTRPAWPSCRAPRSSTLWSNALFKSLLFLAIGLLGVIAGGTTAALLRGAGCGPDWGAGPSSSTLSLAGVPLVVGSFSKESVIDTAYQGASQGSPGLLVLLACW